MMLTSFSTVWDTCRKMSSSISPVQKDFDASFAVNVPSGIPVVRVGAGRLLDLSLLGLLLGFGAANVGGKNNVFV